MPHFKLAKLVAMEMIVFPLTYNSHHGSATHELHSFDSNYTLILDHSRYKVDNPPRSGCGPMPHHHATRQNNCATHVWFRFTLSDQPQNLEDALASLTPPLPH